MRTINRHENNVTKDKIEEKWNEKEIKNKSANKNKKN